MKKTVRKLVKNVSVKDLLTPEYYKMTCIDWCEELKTSMKRLKYLEKLDATAFNEFIHQLELIKQEVDKLYNEYRDLTTKKTDELRIAEVEMYNIATYNEAIYQSSYVQAEKIFKEAWEKHIKLCGQSCNLENDVRLYGGMAETYRECAEHITSDLIPSFKETFKQKV